MQKDRINKLENKIIELDSLIAKDDRKSAAVSWLRLLFVAGAVVFICTSALQQSKWGYFAGGAAFVAFLITVRIHNGIDRKADDNICKKEILLRKIGKMNFSWAQHEDNGESFIDKERSQIKDLDILGDNSLYQFVSAANTYHGRKKLAELLCDTTPDYPVVKARQDAVKELQPMEGFKEKILVCGEKICKNGIRHSKNRKNWDRVILRFEKVVSSNTKHLKPLAGILMWMLPVATVLFLALAILGIGGDFTIWAAILCPLLQLLVTSVNNGRNSSVLMPIFTFCDSAQVYNELFKVIAETDFKSERLTELRIKAKEALEGFSALMGLKNAIGMRYGFMFIIVNGLFMWDYHCLASFDAWKEKYGAKVSEWLEAQGEIEAYVSLGELMDVSDTCCFPELVEKRTELSFKDLYHPLIKGDSVCNSFSIAPGQTGIITGSNMSGKTTFLRSIGVNLLLCYAGGPVMAKEFKTCCMALFTSMRVEDDVSKGISTFYAEILKIKNMVEYSAQNLPMISLIDEIFKGTNSADRILGAESALRKISLPHNITIVTTHDFELCDLENDPKVRALNYHFSEYYENDEIFFEYKLHNGRCRTTNAKFLLKMSGILN